MESEPKPSERDTSRSPDLSSDSDSDSSASNPSSQQIEWLATARQRRSTAGNRMKSMLANEEPDSDLELLFAEDENDQGFSDVGDDGSDVHMDSSSDDEDENKADDDLEGEKELEKQAKERRTAQRKRKAQEAIPAKFRKKVRINPTRPAPAPRPKKKSERASWLPSAADLPTRASSRSTTRISKEQLHQQMVEREERRLKQLDQMAKKAAKLEAMKKPPMTQEERLREAAVVEKRNSKSLNRWEVAEKQREEERLAKLAALNNRTLKGPVITFWSGIGEWTDGRGTHMGQMVLEEKPKKKREKNKDKGKAAGDKSEAPGVGGDGKPASLDAAGPISTPDAGVQSQPQQTTSQTNPPEAPPVTADAPEGTSTVPNKPDTAVEKPPEANTRTEPLPPPKIDDAPRLMAMPPPPPPSQPPSGLAAPAPAPEPPSSGMTPPAGLSRPLESKPSGVLAAPMLAPPPSISVNGVQPPMMGYGLGNPKSNVLALPDTSQRSGPPTLAAPERVSSATPTTNISKATTTTTPTPTPSTSTGSQPPKELHLHPASNPPATLSKAPSVTPSEPLSEPPSEPPPPETVTRNAIIFQNFDENAIKDRSVQTQILFNRKMGRLSKPSPMPLCVITNHPARYRDPKTGLPYCNAYAYREIQRLRRGEYRWSKLLGVWAGSGTYAARGVPERFLHPEKESPNKKKLEEQKASEQKKLAEDEKKDEAAKPVADEVADEPKPSVETVKLEEPAPQMVEAAK